MDPLFIAEVTEQITSRKGIASVLSASIIGFLNVFVCCKYVVILQSILPKLLIVHVHNYVETTSRRHCISLYKICQLLQFSGNQSILLQALNSHTLNGSTQYYA